MPTPCSTSRKRSLPSPPTTTTNMSSSPTMSSPAGAHAYSAGLCRRLVKARHQEIDKMEIRALASLPLGPQNMGMLNVCSTTYVLHIRSADVASRKLGGEWKLNTRYSHCAAFRKSLLQQIRRWETECVDSKKLQPREFQLVSNSLRRPITPNFPRKHMRGDTEDIVQERRLGLREFVRKLLSAYVDISVYVHNSEPSDPVSFSKVRDMLNKLEEFLQMPNAFKELERRHCAAVLALEDVTLDDTASSGESGDHPERTCCICLDDYEDCSDSKTKTDADLLDALWPRVDPIDADQANKLVKLPCGHHFHEDCVIEWLNVSTACPLCRQPAVADEEPVTFDVSIS